MKTSTSGSDASPTTEEANYEYDSEGRLIKADTISTRLKDKFSNATSGKFTYDAEGFLTAYSSLSTMKSYDYFTGNMVTKTKTLLINITYADGKVTGYTAKTVGFYNITTTVQMNYGYDGAGDLIKKTAKTIYLYDAKVVSEKPWYPSGSGPEETWIYDKNQLVDYVLKVDNTESYPAIIQGGLIVKNSFRDAYSIFAYDSQSRLTKNEVFVNQQLNYYYTNEWTDGKPASQALPSFKGFPITKPATGTGLLKTYRFYANYNIPASGIKENWNTTSTYQLNDHGFVTNVSSEYSYIPSGTGSAIVTPSTEVYTYTGCN